MSHQRVRAGARWPLREVSARRTRVLILVVVVTAVLPILPGWNAWRFYWASGALSTQ